MARSGEPLHVPDVQEDPRYVAVGPANRSELAVPLKLRNRVIGVLNVESAKADAFDPDDMKLLSTLAAQAAVAIEHARLHEEQQRRARELAALNTACRAMASTLDIDKVLASAITEARAMLGAEAASVLLHDGAGDALVFSAAAGPGFEELVGTRMPVTAGIAGWIMQEAQPVLIRDAQSDPRFYDRIDVITGLTTRSLLAVPLKYKEQVIGVLEAINKQVGPESPSFTPGDLELLTTLAHHINNRLMTFSLEVDKLERQDLVDQEAVSTVITSARRCIQEVSAVVKALDRLEEIHTVSYVGTAQMIDIEETLQKQLRSIETQRA